MLLVGLLFGCLPLVLIIQTDLYEISSPPASESRHQARQLFGPHVMAGIHIPDPLNNGPVGDPRGFFNKNSLIATLEVGVKFSGKFVEKNLRISEERSCWSYTSIMFHWTIHDH